MSFYKKIATSMFLFSLIVSLVGCDMVSSVKEYFSKKDVVTNTEEKQKEDFTEKTSIPKAKIDKKQEIPSPKTQKMPSKPLPSDVLVRIGQWTITKDDILERIKAEQAQAPESDVDVNDPKLQAAVLDVLVRQQMLFLDAEDKGLDEDKEVKLALEEVRKTLLVQMVVQRLTEKVKVSAEEIKNTYEKIDSPYFYNPLEVRVSEIVVDSQIKATELLLEIQKGGDFSEIAKNNSIGSSASKGGDLGFITEPAFPKMGDVILAMLQEEKDVSDSFKGPKGFYIVKITEKKGGEKKSFEEVKDFIENQLLIEKKDAALLEHLARLEKKLNIEINEELLKQE